MCSFGAIFVIKYIVVALNEIFYQLFEWKHLTIWMLLIVKFLMQQLIEHVYLVVLASYSGRFQIGMSTQVVTLKGSNFLEKSLNQNRNFAKMLSALLFDLVIFCHLGLWETLFSFSHIRFRLWFLTGLWNLKSTVLICLEELLCQTFMRSYYY